jgi:hypothetical protein
MFLGGILDHTVRRVPVSGALNVPAETYRRPVPQTLSWMQQNPGVEVPTQPYYRYRVSSGEDSWFCYILEGHNPPRAHLLDTCPFLRV